MTNEKLSKTDQLSLLSLARQSLVKAANREGMLEVNLADYSKAFQQDGASFVTLTKQGELRGCIGALEAYQPLVLDVVEHAAAAALHDFRFSPVQPGEVAFLHIEISVLSTPVKLDYSTPDELRRMIRPGVDGVILRDGRQRSTFLPQVWEKLPDFDEFMQHLCLKMGAPAHTWEKKPLDVFVYQVFEFHE